MTTYVQTPDRAGASARSRTLIAIYAVLAVLGTVLPYAYFVPFVQTHGLDLREFISQLYATRISAMAWMDILISSVVFWVFMWAEGRRLKMRGWPLLLIPNLTVGLSLALPLFLMRREAKLATSKTEAAS